MQHVSYSWRLWMTRILRPSVLVFLVALTAACSGRGGALPQPAQFPNAGGASDSYFISTYRQPANVRAACGGPVPAGFARCIALVRTDIGGATLQSTSTAYAPAD